MIQMSSFLCAAIRCSLREEPKFTVESSFFEEDRTKMQAAYHYCHVHPCIAMFRYCEVE